MKKYLLIILAALVLVSCEDVIEFNGDETGQKVVMNSLAQADSTLNVRLTFSRFFLSSKPFENIANAELTLVVNGNRYASVNDADGNYHFNYIPQGGDEMTIEAQVPGYDVVKATAKMPRQPIVSDTSMVMKGKQVNYDWGYDRTVNTEVRFKLHDPAGERNYYRLRVDIKDSISYWNYRYNNETNGYVDSVLVWAEGSSYYGNGFTVRDILIVDQDALGAVEDIIDGSTEQGVYEGHQLLFTDEKIDGQEHEIVVTVHNYSYGMDGYSIKPNVSIILEAINKDLYYYIISKENQQNDDGAGLVSEPYRIHSNVEGGIGIFGASSKMVYGKKMPEIIIDDLFTNGK